MSPQGLSVGGYLSLYRTTALPEGTWGGATPILDDIWSGPNPKQQDKQLEGDHPIEV